MTNTGHCRVARVLSVPGGGGSSKMEVWRTEGPGSRGVRMSSSQEGVAHEAVVVADRDDALAVCRRGTVRRFARPRPRAGGGSVPSLAPSPSCSGHAEQLSAVHADGPQHGRRSDPRTSGSASRGRDLQQSDGRTDALRQHDAGRPCRKIRSSGCRGHRRGGLRNLSAAQYGMLMMIGQSAERRDRLGPDQRRRGQCDAAEPPVGRRRPRVTKARSSNRPAAWRARYFNRTSTSDRHPRRASSTGSLATSPDRRRSGVPVVFDLSERAIVPIVSPVKTDPATDAGRARGQEPKRRGTGRFPR